MIWKLAVVGTMGLVGFVAMALLFAQGERELAVHERREYQQ